MKNRTPIAALSSGLLALALALPQPALAKANPAEPKDTKFGIGLGLESGTSLLDMLYDTGMFRIEPLMSSTSLRFPIQTSGGLRIEPELGLLHAGVDGEKYNDWKVATGLFPSWGLGKEGLAYAGGRIGLTGMGDGGSSWTDFLLGVGAGGEFWVSSYFTLGGEVQLNLVKYGEDLDGYSITTNAALLVRFYFN